MKLPEKKTLAEIKKYFEKNSLRVLIKNIETKNIKGDKRLSKTTYGPDLQDLYRIHRMIILNKRMSVLEYGTGWSSLVILNALKINESKYLNKVKNFRIKKKFSLTIVDNDKKYINISKQRINKILKEQTKNISFHYSKCLMTKVNNNICSYFSNHPRINPDFIYLDGPDQFKIKGKINNISIADIEMMPMNSDILFYENFLVPGTIIVADGRTANARFLMNNFKRKWDYFYDKANDQNIFYLAEKSLGHVNDKMKFFYESK